MYKFYSQNKMKDKLKKLAELITHPEPEFSRQGRMLFVDLNFGYQGTLELLYILAPELESRDFIWINEVSRYLNRFLTFWIMAELARYPETEGKVQRIDGLGINRSYKSREEYPENIHQMTTMREITVVVTTSEEDWYDALDICYQFPFIESLELHCQFISTEEKTLIPSDLATKLPNLRHLSICGIQLENLHESILALRLESLHLADIRQPVALNAAALGKLTRIFDMDTLEELSLAEYLLETLPPEIEKLSKLRVLRLDLKQLQTVPESLGHSSKLEHLDITAQTDFSISPSWLRNSPIKVIEFDSYTEETALSWLWEEESTMDEILRFLPYCKNDTIVQKLLELWGRKTKSAEDFIKQLELFGPFQSDRILDLDYYNDFYSEWNYHQKLPLALWTMGVLFRYPKFHAQREQFIELKLHIAVCRFLPVDFIDTCRIQKVTIDGLSTRAAASRIEKLSTITSLRTIYCTPYRLAYETVFSVPHFKGRADVYINDICGAESPQINQGRLARYLRDRIRRKINGKEVPCTAQWVQSFLAELFHPEDGAISIFLRLGHTISFPGFGSFQLQHYQKRERYMLEKYLAPDERWVSDEDLKEKYILFAGGNRIRFKAFSDLKQRINQTEALPNEKVISRGDKSIAYFVLGRLQKRYPEQYAKGTLFLSTKSCLFLIQSIFDPKEGGIAHYLSQIPRSQSPWRFNQPKVFFPEFGRFQIRTKLIKENQSKSYYIHFKSFSYLSEIVR